MLKKNLKNYIEEAVRDKYQKIDKSQSNVITLREKINNFDRFLDVYIKDETYGNYIEKFYLELEKMVCDEEKMSFKQGVIIDEFLKILASSRNIRLDSTNNLENLRTLNIITNDEMLEDIKLYFNDKTSLEKYLENKGRIDLIPIVDSCYISSNINNLDYININMYWDYISNLFIAYLELANKLKDNIMQQYILSNLNIREYIHNIIENYENKINFKYIPSSVVKLTSYDFLDEFDDENEMTLPFTKVNDSGKYKKIKLIGYAGVGKTTTLEYIEYQDALNYDKTNIIPVIISLITVNEITSIEALICRKLNIDEENEEVIKYLIRKNKINLYLDGINEINILDGNKRKEFLNLLEDFINKKENKDLKVIVTDRDNDKVSVLNSSNTFLIQGMNDSDINEFIEGNSMPDKVLKIKEEINKNEEILDAITHPIMLKNIITIIECENKLPQNIEDLVSVYLDSIIKRELEEKSDEYANYINDFLKYLVKNIVTTKDVLANPPISHFEIIPIFYEIADSKKIEDFDASRFLDLLIKMGILKEVEFQKYAFSDERFFQKYYNDIIEEID